MLPTKYRFIWPSGIREEEKKIDQSEKELPVTTMFVKESGRNVHLYRGPSIDASYQNFSSFSLAVSEKIFKNRPIRNMNGLWWPCLLHREEMCNLYRGPSIDASNQVSVHLARWF